MPTSHRCGLYAYHHIEFPCSSVCPAIQCINEFSTSGARRDLTQLGQPLSWSLRSAGQPDGSGEAITDESADGHGYGDLGNTIEFAKVSLASSAWRLEQDGRGDARGLG